MERRRRPLVSIVSSTFIILYTLATYPSAVAQQQPASATQQQPVSVQQEQSGVIAATSQASEAQARVAAYKTAVIALANARAGVKLKSTADLSQRSALGWGTVNNYCEDPSTVQCAQAAIAEVNLECTESAKFFRKGSTAWTVINFGMLITSSIFTAVGASTTIANAKVYSTLGASTALGIVATSAMTNSAADQGGLLAINSTLDSFLKFVQSGGSDGKPADSDLVFETAPIYGAKCTAAAASTGK